ncbi:helix-turn-helix domain-containing protein [Micromonospora sp. NBC_01655]|uniref:helix-turn-helix domain-containing protein n=1 Tax=Micromonospora sp. NBC_01655 TaxID=2975983 RepID=UPI00224C8028|nr:helix-turn-helix domain-containing protein [Micromonospora sp. NBC_01655]MCX4474847.1 helix-turn-helix domain-containing protein [Micromonospora sp. NBC_01655]
MIPEIEKTAPPATRDLYPVNDVAYRLGVTPRKVWMLISKNRIRTKRLDGRRLVPADALAEFIANLPDGDSDKASAA